MRKLNLNNLKRGLLGISEAAGAFMAEAAMVCLEKNGHESGVILKISGEFEEEFSIIWSANITPTIEDTWKDRNETTEYAASGIALLLIHELTKYKAFERSRGKSFDYVLKKHFLNSNNKKEDIALLEVSGLWRETKSNTVNMRVSVKKKQLKKIPRGLETYIVVTEFNIPKTKIVKR